MGGRTCCRGATSLNSAVGWSARMKRASRVTADPAAEERGAGGRPAVVVQAPGLHPPGPRPPPPWPPAPSRHTLHPPRTCASEPPPVLPFWTPGSPERPSLPLPLPPSLPPTQPPFSTSHPRRPPRTCGDEDDLLGAALVHADIKTLVLLLCARVHALPSHASPRIPTQARHTCEGWGAAGTSQAAGDRMSLALERA